MDPSIDTSGCSHDTSSDRDRVLLANVRARWIATIASIARRDGACNPIERRRLSRWSSAIEILRERVARAEEVDRELQEQLTGGKR